LLEDEGTWMKSNKTRTKSERKEKAEEFILARGRSI
jgi:hypothetical protein